MLKRERGEYESITSVELLPDKKVKTDSTEVNTPNKLEYNLELDKEYRKKARDQFAKKFNPIPMNLKELKKLHFNTKEQQLLQEKEIIRQRISNLEEELQSQQVRLDNVQQELETVEYPYTWNIPWITDLNEIEEDWLAVMTVDPFEDPYPHLCEGYWIDVRTILLSDDPDIDLVDI